MQKQKLCFWIDGSVQSATCSAHGPNHSGPAVAQNFYLGWLKDLIFSLVNKKRDMAQAYNCLSCAVHSVELFSLCQLTLTASAGPQFGW